ncbi:hypothetical protein BKA62DRAFT_208755 [Auriculariales sp. MPI-PUGE-AT-0066]|nr:hypothetical protein BKA62DRAFT_208755 [Auriculariales sp. MPI-PUGE-AT-0066]
MNSAFSAPTGQAAYAPLQPTADTVNVPQGLDSNAPGYTHPQNASNVTQDLHAATGLKSHPPTGAYGDSAATGYGAQQQQQAPHASQGLTGGALGHNSNPQYGTGATHDIPGATGYQSHPANDSTGYQSQSVNDSTTTGGGYGAHPTSHGLDVGAPGHTPIPQHAQDHHTATHPRRTRRWRQRQAMLRTRIISSTSQRSRIARPWSWSRLRRNWLWYRSDTWPYWCNWSCSRPDTRLGRNWLWYWRDWSWHRHDWLWNRHD